MRPHNFCLWNWLFSTCWIISSMGSSTVRSWLVSTIDSHTVVFVWLLTHLQGASTTLAKHESTFIDYILLGLINSNTNELQVAPVLKSQFKNLELELSIWHLQSTNQALCQVAGIFKSSPLKDAKSDHHNTQGRLSREHQNALGDGWEVWGQPLSEEVWWIGLGHDEVRPTVKCNTSDRPSWGQVQRYHLWPLRMGASANTAERVHYTLLAVAISSC